jgi:hypothetical protein
MEDNGFRFDIWMQDGNFMVHCYSLEVDWFEKNISSGKQLSNLIDGVIKQVVGKTYSSIFQSEIVLHERRLIVHEMAQDFMGDMKEE